MKICCSQEYYDKVVQYAKSINDKTLENCLERLKQWEKNENRPCEIELMEIRTNPLQSPWNVSTDGAYIHN